MPSVDIIVDAVISDRSSAKLLGLIASSESSTGILLTKLNLTRKQYYSKMFRLVKAGIVKRQKGRYSLTAFGRVIYTAHKKLEMEIESALKDYWKLRAIDSMDLSTGDEEHDRVISTLIENQQIKNVLLTHISKDKKSQISP